LNQTDRAAVKKKGTEENGVKMVLTPDGLNP
jgi:hypothetical protein